MKRFTLIALPLALAACSSGEVRDTLGLNRSAPDEFAVVSRPPLSVPPEFALRPPAPGSPPRSAENTEYTARSLVLRPSADGRKTPDALEKSSVDTAVTPVVSGELPTSSEASFVSKLGTDKADPAIRTKISEDEQAEPPPQENESLLESVLGISGQDPEVDAKEEAKRLRDNKDKGKPVNEGEVKTIDPKKRSVLDQILE